MIDKLKALAERAGGRLEAVAVERLQTIKDELALLQKEKTLNGFQNWIINHMYNFNSSEDNFTRRSVLIVALPPPASYANVTFKRLGKEYKLYSIMDVSFTQLSNHITEAVTNAGYKIKPENALPMKRLAVQSGLAEYGRNNITYVDGMGSFLSYAAFSTDIPLAGDNWRDATVSPVCDGCDICVGNCPTGAIREDEFIIDNVRCLSCLNESTDDFPEWLPRDAHHTIFDCLKCQVPCPMNARCLTSADVSFDEMETERILAGAPYDGVTEELAAKIKLLDLGQWASVPRNLRLMFEMIDGGHIPTI